MISTSCETLFFPAKRGWPSITSAATQAVDQMSISVPYCVAPKISSGAR